MCVRLGHCSNSKVVARFARSAWSSETTHGTQGRSQPTLLRRPHAVADSGGTGSEIASLASDPEQTAYNTHNLRHGLSCLGGGGGA